MTPKEKAFELVYKYYKITKEFEFIKGEGLVPYYGSAKQCALIAVDELIESHLLLTTTHEAEPSIRCKTYWQEVKKEIELL
jgi:hypothetical protein